MAKKSHINDIPVREALAKLEKTPPAPSLVIDMKPNNKTSLLNFFEVFDVWGCSEYSAEREWSPVLLHLREISYESNTGNVNRESHEFKVNEDKAREAVFSFLYLAGTVTAGKLVGKWTPPRASPTNSALLWKRHLDYFFRQIREATQPEHYKYTEWHGDFVHFEG